MSQKRHFCSTEIKLSQHILKGDGFDSGWWPAEVIKGRNKYISREPGREKSNCSFITVCCWSQIAGPSVSCTRQRLPQFQRSWSKWQVKTGTWHSFHIDQAVNCIRRHIATHCWISQICISKNLPFFGSFWLTPAPFPVHHLSRTGLLVDFTESLLPFHKE